MGDYFTGLEMDYENAECRSIMLHDRKTKAWVNILAIIELIPPEQEPSPLIGQANVGYCERENVDKAITVYVSRRIICPLP